MQENLTCALDLSGPFASFALSKGGNLLVSNSSIFESRNNGFFFQNFFTTISRIGIEASMIDCWIIGTGPGSFTGLRVAAAYALGTTYCTNKKIFGLPSAFPVAITLDLEEHETVGIIFPCSRETVYLCSISIMNKKLIMPNIPECIAKRNLSQELGFSRIAAICLAEDYEIIKSFAPAHIPITFFYKFPVEKMLFGMNYYYSQIQDTIYSRPPSMTLKAT